MVSGREAFTTVKKLLQQAGMEDFDFEARQLFQHYCKVNMLSSELLAQNESESLLLAAQKRAEGYPLQYIIGSWGFLELELEVGPGVLIPRAETEEVCLAAIETLQNRENPRVLDLCAGSGALALGIQANFPKAKVTAVELDEQAFRYLEKNVMAFSNSHGYAPAIVKGDALHYCETLQRESLDVLVSNPPYVSFIEYENLAPELYHEPKIALVAQQGGLAFYQSFIPNYYPCLKPGGWFVFEIGMGQGEALEQLLLGQGCQKVGIRKDLSGRPRIALGQKPY